MNLDSTNKMFTHLVGLIVPFCFLYLHIMLMFRLFCRSASNKMIDVCVRVTRREREGRGREGEWESEREGEREGERERERERESEREREREMVVVCNKNVEVVLNFRRVHLIVNFRRKYYFLENEDELWEALKAIRKSYLNFPTVTSKIALKSNLIASNTLS